VADAPITLTEHLATQQPLLAREHAPGVAALVGRIGRVAAVISHELAHAALRDRLGYIGGVNVTVPCPGGRIKGLYVRYPRQLLSPGRPQDTGVALETWAQDCLRGWTTSGNLLE